MKVYMGIDVGSISTKTAVIDDAGNLLCHTYLPTQGNPIVALQDGLKQLEKRLPDNADICGVATTGSARYLAGVIVGADTIKNEITSQAAAALHYMPDVRTIIEIGGQDSKIIIIREGATTDFSMNTICAAGTGSFLDHQAQRLNLTIRQFSRLAVESTATLNVSGKCTVFAESDIIHKQQSGHRIEGIVYGLCQALVRNYLSNVGLGKEISPPILFQGGVAFNEGIVRAFKEELKADIIVPEHHEIMGAIGAALLVREEMEYNNSCFKGFNVSQQDYKASSLECEDCPRLCQITRLSLNGNIVDSWGEGCGSQRIEVQHELQMRTR
jgi:predicted CoA-substrate-specific enzyme activase